jgi:hypothetical protein
MPNSIEEALKQAVEQVESGTVRVKKLLARKTNLQRKKRQHLPKTLR